MPKWTVVVTEPINEAGVKFLEHEGVEVIHLPPGSKESTLLDVASKATGFITRGGVKVTREIMVASPKLKAMRAHDVR
jgi:phosphoglycerate dehydrogenase-like enzyme